MLSTAISNLFGVGESQARLYAAILLSYPLAIFYKHAVQNRSPALRNAYSLATGLGIAYYFAGANCIHAIISIVLTYAMCVACNAASMRSWAGIFSMLLKMSYLLWGYYVTATEEYDICWTMPQCLLCLRMIGYAYDYADGENFQFPDKKSEETNEADSANVAAKQAALAAKEPAAFPYDSPLSELPSLLETMGYGFFFPSFLIGPLFSFRLYSRFLHNQHLPGGVTPPGQWKSAGLALGIGLFYTVTYVLLSGYFPSSFAATDEFGGWPFWKRLGWVLVAGRAVLYKYFGAWNICEGSLILTGIAFNGFDKENKPRWSALNNLNALGYESATALSGYIESFNINTNHWSKRYLFKRLKSLNNRNISAAYTLFFLAIWHGMHIGYFMCFFMEFIYMEAERRGARLIAPLKKAVGAPVLLVQWVITSLAIGFPLMPFDLLTWSKSWQAWSNLNFFGLWAVIAIIVVDTMTPRNKKN